MKRLALVLLLLVSVLAWAAPTESPVEYNITVHVVASHSIVDGRNDRNQLLKVVIDGKKYELKSLSDTVDVLALGDYRARLVKDEHGKGGYDLYVFYEFQIPDKKTRRYRVVGIFE